MTPPGDHLLETTASPSSLDEVHALFARLWADVPDVSPMDRNAFETAVAEVAANVIEYAGTGDTVVMRLLLRALEDRVEAYLEDLGHPYDDQGAARSAVDDSAERGRGLFIARALTDELTYERDGSLNRWFLRRQRQG
jgi:serine/threonine-protein kinase RsbW